MMKTAIFTVIALAIASSLVAHEEYTRWSGPLPSIVEKNLPASISARDVLVHEGCFFYLYEGEVFPVTQSSRGAFGLPVCIG